jgi:hypothetical protein
MDANVEQKAGYKKIKYSCDQALEDRFGFTRKDAQKSP